MKQNDQALLALLHKELKTVMGCTEPAAAALAGALARELLGRTPERASVSASRDLIKNVMGVGIPNSSFAGIDSAVGIGIFYGDPKAGLNILSQVAPGDQPELTRFMEQGGIRVSLAKGVPSVYISVRLSAGSETASVTIAGEHDKVVEKVKNGTVLLQESETDRTGAEGGTSGYPEEWSVREIYDFVNRLSEEDGRFLLQAAAINKTIAEHSLAGSYGLEVGSSMQRNGIEELGSRDDAFRYGAVLASAASDARMAGCSLPVVINSGSGNQGLTATLPVLVLAEYLKTDSQTLVRALALSNLVAIYLAYHKGRLSALCGAYTAAIGTACAYVYLLEGEYEKMENVINIMFANMMGIICDGAKATCALKIHSCLESAAMSATLALNGSRAGSEAGILGNGPEETIEYAKRISHEGMERTDKTILSIMVDKKT